jgi:integrating conjugative element protein (TIGR03755 family)
MAFGQQVGSSSLYYRLGGGGPAGRALNKSQLPTQLGVSSGIRANYSCSKFDIGLSWGNVMNGISNLGSQVNGAVQAGIAALPLYALQRAQPGLYQIFQNYSAKADAMVSASVRSCEEMEAQIAQGKNPYEDFVKLSKSESWRTKTQNGGDVVQAKLDIAKNEEGQKNGVRWVFNQPAGGLGSAPLRPIRDLSVAGYNSTLNRPTTTAPNTNFSSGNERATRLVQAFKSADDLATFTTQVLGDQQVYLCSGMSGCPASTSVTTATGLGPRYDMELDALAPRMESIANGSANVSFADLNAISAPGMTISPQLVDGLRRLNPETRSMAVTRLSQELAMQRVIDKALVARNVLLTSLSLPEVVAAGEVSATVQTKLDRLTRYIDDMMYEFRIRKEMTGETALAIMGDSLSRNTQALRVPDGNRVDPNPLENGRVRTPTP